MSTSKTYDTFDWAIRIFIGSAIESSLFNLLAVIIRSNSELVSTSQGPAPAWETAPLFYGIIALIAIIMIAPFLLSLALSKIDVELEDLRIVPPQYIAYVGSVYAAVFVILVPLAGQVYQPQFANSALVSLLAISFLLFVVLGGRAEDKLTVAILGRTADKQQIYFEKLTIDASLEEVKTKLTTREYADNLFLRMDIEGDKNKGYTVKTERGYDFVAKVGMYPDDEDKNKTILKAAFYQQSRYSLKVTKFFIENDHRQASYLAEILTDREPPMKIETIIPLTNSAHDIFVNEVIDDLRGFYVKTKKAPRVSVILVMTNLALTGMTIGFAALGYPQAAYLTTGGVEGLILLVTVLDYLRKG